MMKEELIVQQHYEETTNQTINETINPITNNATENIYCIGEKMNVPTHELSTVDTSTNEDLVSIFVASTANIEENVAKNTNEVNNLSSALESQSINEDRIMEIDGSINHTLQNQTEAITKDNSIDSTDEIIKSNNSNENENFVKLSYDWTVPKLICLAKKEFKRTEKCENFTKGCHWSPDGTCILVAAEDFRYRIFDVPQELYSGKLPKDFVMTNIESSLQVKEGGTIYDTCWFPYMNSWDPTTCCYLSASQESPIHLWDAFTGQLRATYRAYNQVDEVEPSISVQFTDLGEQIWSGYKNCLRTFDTNRPGRQTNDIIFKKDFPNITGLVSCIRENPSMNGLIAFGTYSKYIGLYKDGPLCSFKTSSGVTQIEFSPCGTKLFSSVRRGSEFLCWDLRNPGSVLYSLQTRQSDTNQRIYFSLSYSGEEIVSGGTDGAVRVWKIPEDLQIEADLEPYCQIQMTKDCINGVNLHKNLPILAISTGTRICEEEEENIVYDNSLKLYWLQKQ